MKTPQHRLMGVLLILLLAVAIPSAGVLGFLWLAVENETLATRQRLVELVEQDLGEEQTRLLEFFNERIQPLENWEGELSQAKVLFEKYSQSNLNPIFLDEEGEILFPHLFFPSESPPSDHNVNWVEAEKLEFQEGAPAEAAEVYSRIASQSEVVSEQARALLARARCLARVKEPTSALEILTETLQQDRFREAHDTAGNRIDLQARLMASNLVDDVTRYLALKSSIRSALENDFLEIPLAQQLFLYSILEERIPGKVRWPVRYLEKGVVLSTPGKMLPSSVERLWQYRSQNGNALLLVPERELPLLFMEENPSDRSKIYIPGGVFAFDSSDNQSVVQVIPSGATLAPQSISISLGETFPGWRLAYDFNGQNPFEMQAQRNIVLYFSFALMTVLFIILTAAIVISWVLRQMKLTRLKNDLIATVSHELKTPLAGMRLMTETLMDDRVKDEGKRREYLEMIERENRRLSRLIDNFLGFSRMERNKQSFQFKKVNPKDMALEAAEVFRDRPQEAECRFEVDIREDLPPVKADPDALLTVLVNLLDNAWKYSGEDKKITLQVDSSREGWVNFKVTDNGIGIAPSEQKKIFKRFFQSDTSLSRRAGGCGLGLSISEFIIRAHGGTIEVSSRPGKGSTFTVLIPFNKNGQ